jgi:8-oxo-dGTP diphosphatase
MAKLERSVLAVDVVLFRINEGDLAVLLHRREEEPFGGAWSLPGVAVRSAETLETAAKRALLEKGGLPETSIPELHLEQLYTFDALYRDPRGRTVSVAHMGLVPLLDSAQSPGHWRPIAAVEKGSLPFDHDQILETAVVRLRGKLRYTNIAARLLPETFRIDELQAVYEAVLGRSINRANFRNKLLRIGLIEQAGVKAEAVGRRGGRPPHLYRFTKEGVEAQERDFV